MNKLEASLSQNDLNSLFSTKRYYQVKHLGIVLATGEEPVIKIYTKPTNEADRKAIENLLKGND